MFMNWILAEMDTPSEQKAAMLRISCQFLGTSGMVEQDDSDTWWRIQPVNATHSLNISAGVRKPSVLRGLSFNCLAIALS